MFSWISKGNDNDRLQMANKKIPFKYARPVEEWLQEKGNVDPASSGLVDHLFFLNRGLTLKGHCVMLM